MLLKHTIDYMNETSMEHRSKLGQFFTKKYIRDFIFENIELKDSAKVCEMNCGTGEFIYSFLEYFKNPEIYCFDIDEKLVNMCVEHFGEKIKLCGCCDSLYLRYENFFDYVIGNPPYFEFKDEELRFLFGNVINGRMNIYSLFIKKAIDMVKEDGMVALVVPTSMNNGKYFSKLRKFIIDNTEILMLKAFSDNDFDANQNVQVIILRKRKFENKKFIFQKNDILLFSENYEELKSIYNNTYSLKELGFDVKTGFFTWNEHKELLTNDSSYPTIIWSHNINNEFELSNKKPQYAKVSRFLDCPAIVVNRITGCGKKASLKMAYIEGMRYVPENHVNVIFETENSKITLKRLYDILSSQDNSNIIKVITGNTQISKNELLNLIPVRI